MANAAKNRALLVVLIGEQTGRCFYCDVQFEQKGHRQPTLDHVRPLCLGGRRYRQENTVAACSGCNARKGPLDAETFIRLRGHGRLLKCAIEEFFRIHPEIRAPKATRRTQPPRLEARTITVQPAPVRKPEALATLRDVWPATERA